MTPIDRKLQRIRIGIDQKTAARQLGVSTSYLSRLENEGYDCNPKIAKAYDNLLARLLKENQGGNGHATL